MKNIVLIMAGMILAHVTSAQLKTTAVCPPFVVDALDGNVSKLYLKSTVGEIQKKFPCFTELVEDTTNSKCIGVFYKDQDISFFTGRSYIEIGEKFKGTINPPLMGANRNSLFKMLGYPKIKDVTWDAFQTEYGTLVLYYDTANKIKKLQITNKSTESLKLCE